MITDKYNQSKVNEMYLTLLAFDPFHEFAYYSIVQLCIS